MAVALRNTASNSTGAGASVSSLLINKPTGTVQGDVMIANLGSNQATTAVWSLAGWAAVPGFTAQSQGSNTLQNLLYKIAGGSEPTNYTFNISSSGKLVGNIAAYSGVDNNNPFAGIVELLSIASTTVNFPAFNPQALSTYPVLLGVVSNATATITTTTSTGFTMSADTSTTITRFLEAWIQDTHTVLTTPLTAFTAGNSTANNASTQAKTVLGLRADISGATTPTSDTALFAIASGSSYVLPSYNTGYANELQAVVVMGATNTTTYSVADTAGQTWTSRIDGTGGSRHVQIFTTQNASLVTGNVVTVTPSVSDNSNVMIHTLTGVDTTNPIGNTASGSGTNPQQVSITTSVANSTVIGGVSTSSYAAPTAATGNTATGGSLFSTGTAGSYSLQATSLTVTPGAFTFGSTAPTSLTNTIAALEILAPGVAVAATGSTLMMMGVG